MKKSTSLITAGLFSAFLLFSCGGSDENYFADTVKSDSSAQKKEEPKAQYGEVCKDANAISITVKDYKYGMSGKFEYANPSFEVKQSDWTLKTDSTAELVLKNYAAADLTGDRKDDQIDIRVNLYAKKGKKIEPADYPYNDYSKDMYSTVQLITSKGTVYFNWIMGMPEVGGVKINYAGEDGVCGTFALASEKPESETIGTVRMNGYFKAAK